MRWQKARGRRHRSGRSSGRARAPYLQHLLAWPAPVSVPLESERRSHA
jgi:hypothetical protein